MTFDWKSLLGTAAPLLASALGGPLAGIATKSIIGALGLSDTATEKDIAAAMAGATPETLLALKKADNDFEVQMEQLNIDLQKVNAGDRDSARRREVDGHDSTTPRLLAMTITLGFFGVLAWMLVHGLPNDAGGRDAMLLMLGSLGTAWAGVTAYYFGSTSSSRGKDQTIQAAVSK